VNARAVSFNVRPHDRIMAPVVAEFEDSLSLIVSDAKQEARKIGRADEVRFQPTSSIAVELARSPDQYRSGLVAWQQRTAGPVHDAAAGIYRAGSQGG
jgi:hypothetical protein